MEDIEMTNVRIAIISLASMIVADFVGTGALPAQSSGSTTQKNRPLEGGSGVRDGAKPTIVLVHGAFADGTGWQHVIPILERDGYGVIAVQNPLTSLADDVETTKRVIESQKGPVVQSAIHMAVQ
jgi:pimeloyl-ACP methyl ester carboxylesterase